MKRFLIPVCALLFLTGCVDKEAREYAARLSELLGSYQKDIEKRIQTEERFYRDSAKDFRDESDIDVNRLLSLERDERSRELLAELQEKGRAPSTALLQQRLRDYGNVDFDSTRRLLERETSAETEFLLGLQDLDGQAIKIKTLNKALKELAKAPSVGDQLTQLQAFATGVKTEIDRLDCGDLKKALDQTTDKKKAIEARVKPLGATPELKEANKLELEKLAKQINALDTTASALTLQRLDRGCSN